MYNAEIYLRPRYLRPRYLLTRKNLRFVRAHLRGGVNQIVHRLALMR